ncbi:MAG: hypothetical protein WCL27_00650 [Betaproteobacteria bacterium]
MRMNCSTDKSSCTSKCLKIGLLAILGIAALGGVVMLLWNWLIPTLFFGAQPVDYCQALGILLLSKILFGGFRGGCHGRWKERRQHWESMTPEEREQLKGQYKSRWSKWCCSEKAEGQAPATSSTPRE